MIGLVILTDASAWLIDEALTFEDIAAAGILAVFFAFFYLRLRPSSTGSTANDAPRSLDVRASTMFAGDTWRALGARDLLYMGLRLRGCGFVARTYRFFARPGFDTDFVPRIGLRRPLLPIDIAFFSTPFRRTSAVCSTLIKWSSFWLLEPSLWPRCNYAPSCEARAGSVNFYSAGIPKSGRECGSSVDGGAKVSEARIRECQSRFFAPNRCPRRN
jgi:hypothetical protein